MPEVTTPEAARQTLKTALDAWKAGSDSKSLAQGNQAVYVTDEDWMHGDRLTDYSIVDQGSQFGIGVRFVVELQVTSAKSGAEQKRARYVVSNNPVPSVSRDDTEGVEEGDYTTNPATATAKPKTQQISPPKGEVSDY